MVQYVYEIWQNNTVILIVRNLDRIYNLETQKLIEDFLTPLVNENQNPYYYLSIFLVDKDLNGVVTKKNVLDVRYVPLTSKEKQLNRNYN